MATSYWEHRAALRQAAYDRANNKVVESVIRAYDRMMHQLDKDIDAIMATYTRKTGLSPKEAYDFLYEGVPQSVMDDLRSRVSAISDPRQRQRLEVMLRTDEYRARIGRLDAIKASIRVGLTEAAEVELERVGPHLRDTARLAYYHSLYDVQLDTGIGFQGVGVPRRTLDTILKSKWSGTHYSTSVWQSRDAMAGILDRALMEVSGMGKLSDKTMQDVRGMVDLNKWRRQVKSKFKTEAQYSKYAANRLIRTESAYVANQTTAVAYDECGIEKYEYMATLDSRTSEKCSGLDGKIFEMSEKEVGVNFPPLHPHCRSSVAPVIDGLVREGLTRSARDANGKSVHVPRDMKYQEWRAWQKDGAPSDVSAWRVDRVKETKGTQPLSIDPSVPTLTKFEEYRKKYIRENDWHTSTVGQETQSKFLEMQKAALEQHDFVIKARGKNAIKILEEGRFKNQFETGTSGGHLGDIRVDVSQNLFGWEGDELQPHEYEKYGYLANKDHNAEIKSDPAAQYGDISFVMNKERLAGRVTYTMDDSLSPGKDQLVVAAPVDTPDLLTVPFSETGDIEQYVSHRVQAYYDDFKRTGEAPDPTRLAGYDYIELQYHGDISLEHVQSVYFPYDAFQKDPIRLKLKELLDAKGIPWEEIKPTDDLYRPAWLCRKLAL